jgi:hypothetical protein
MIKKSISSTTIGSTDDVVWHSMKESSAHKKKGRQFMYVMINLQTSTGTIIKDLQVIDSTPQSLSNTNVLPRVKRAYQSYPLKLVVILRDPVDRYASLEA